MCVLVFKHIFITICAWQFLTPVTVLWQSFCCFDFENCLFYPETRTSSTKIGSVLPSFLHFYSEAVCGCVELLCKVNESLKSTFQRLGLSCRLFYISNPRLFVAAWSYYVKPMSRWSRRFSGPGRATCLVSTVTSHGRWCQDPHCMFVHNTYRSTRLYRTVWITDNMKSCLS